MKNILVPGIAANTWTTVNIPVLAIVGRGRCGKDTAGLLLRDTFHLRFVGGCSWAGRHFVARRLGVSVDEAWNTRHARRREWFDLLNQFRADDPTALVKEVLKENDFVCGCRSGVELRAAKAQGLVDLVVWVERASAPFDPTLEFGPEDADVVVTNDLELDHYWAKWRRFGSSLGLPAIIK